MLKFFLTILFLIVISHMVFGQDNIIPKNTNNSLKSQNDSIQILHHKSGFWERRIWLGDKKLNKNEVRKIYENDSEALKFYNTGKTLNTLSYVVEGASIGILGWQVGRMINKKAPVKAFSIAGLSGLMVGLGLSISGDICIKKSVIIYDAHILKVYSYHYQLHLGPTSNGVGLCLRF